MIFNRCYRSNNSMKEYGLCLSCQGFSDLVLGVFFLMFGAYARSVTGWDLSLIFCGILAWFYLVKAYKRLDISWRANFYPLGYQLLLFLYLLVVAVMILRGYTSDNEFQWKSTFSMLRFHLLDSTYILPYLMPIVLFVPYRYYSFSWVVKLSKWMALLTLFAFVVFFPQIVLSAKFSMMQIEAPAGLVQGTDIVIYGNFCFISLCWAYIPKSIWKFNLLGLLVCLLALMIAARRGDSLSYFIVLVYLVIQYFKHHGAVAKLFILLMLLLGVYFILSSDLFSFIFQRGMEDTRSFVEKTMLSQMSDFEMFIGKGLNGRYFCPLHEEEYLDGWRYGIETGFYNIVLKGGYLMACLYIILLVIPAYKGCFKSCNQLCRAGGFYIFLSLFELYPFGWLTFDIKFLIIWMMVALCMNPVVRKMSDEDVKRVFFNAK